MSKTMITFSISYKNPETSGSVIHNQMIDAVNVADAITRFNEKSPGHHVISVSEKTLPEPAFTLTELREILFNNTEDPRYNARGDNEPYGYCVLDEGWWENMTTNGFFMNSPGNLGDIVKRLHETIAPDLSVYPVYDDEGIFDLAFIVGVRDQVHRYTRSRMIHENDLGIKGKEGHDIAVAIADTIMKEIAFLRTK